MSPEEKRKQINQLYNLENIMLKEYLDGVVDADVDFVLEKTMFAGINCNKLLSIVKQTSKLLLTLIAELQSRL